MRGNLFIAHSHLESKGPIPACAGQPACATSQMRHAWAYPRVCGATGNVSEVIILRRGLSPRVRGNRQKLEPVALSQGPIPACAGQPSTKRTPSRKARAYPRVCGATVFELSTLAYQDGLSPRVRGNLARFVHAPYQFGPIPACAGQPVALP